MSRCCLAILALVWTASSAGAAEREDFFYIGEAELWSDDRGSMGSQVILIHKTHDPDADRMREAAVVVKPDGTAEESIIDFEVAEGDADNTFTVTGAGGTIEGEGQFSGPAWEWNYFKATFRSQNGVTIEDQNTMADESVITARKTITLPGGRVLMHMDITLKAITPGTHRILKTALLGGDAAGSEPSAGGDGPRVSGDAPQDADGRGE